MSESVVSESQLNENKYTIIDPRGNTAGTGTKDQANRRVKTLGGNKKGYFVVPAKSALKARRAMEKFKFDFKNRKLQDKMSGFYFDDEMFGESVVNEAKYDIGMARKGNGLTVYNKAEEENGDYKTIAHIDNKGKVKYFDKKLPNNIKKEIEKEMAKMKESIAETKGNTMKLKSLIHESYGYGELPSEKLMKMKISAKDMLDSVKNNTPIDETTINEGGFATWEMSFADMTLSGVKLSKKKVYKVKARNTVEAIKKAAKMAGVKDGDWIATQTHSLKKIG